MNTDSNLPIKDTDSFLAENETMDLSPIKGESFLVAVSTGDRSKSKFLSTTVRGPYSYTEMLEEVGVMWKEHQHHAKVVILNKKRDARLKTLDENTVDYIESNYLDLITDAMLEGVFDKDYTCLVGVVETESEAANVVSEAPLP